MFQEKDWREAELDLMHNFVELPSDASSSVEYVDGKPGFVRFLYDPLYPKYFTKLPLRNTIRECKPKPQPETRYINPTIMKDNMKQLVAPFDTTYVQLVGSLFMGHAINITKAETGDTETTSEQLFDIKEADNSLLVHVSIDQVLSFPSEVLASTS